MTRNVNLHLEGGRYRMNWQRRERAFLENLMENSWRLSS